MRPIRCALQLTPLFIIVFVFATGAMATPSFPEPATPGHAITDAAGVINKEDAAAIDRLAAALRAEKGLAVSVVTIRSLAAQNAQGYTIERYAAELLQSLDEQTRSHGMLLLVASDDRRARIQLGSAWGTAHDERARRVMDRLILPAFRNGDLSKGILDGVRGFDAMGRQRQLPAVGQPSWMPQALVVEGLDEPWWLLPAIAGGIVVLIVMLVSLIRRGRRGWAWAVAAFVFGLLLARFLGGSAEASDAEGGATGSW